jgi:hypothetical protein
MARSEERDEQDDATERSDRPTRPAPGHTDVAAWGEYGPDAPPRLSYSDTRKLIANVDGLAAVLEHYPLDDESRRQATESGRRMALECAGSAWSQAGPNERKAAAYRFAAVTEQTMQTTPREFQVQEIDAEIDAETPDGHVTGGTADGDQVVVSPALLEPDDAKYLVMTIAHEYRHNWQRDVITGEAEHPFGETARERLLYSALREQPDDTDLIGSTSKGHEVDADAFALVATAAYQQASEELEEQDRRRSKPSNR